MLPLRLPTDVVGRRGVGVVWYFRAAGGALVWAPFCCLLVFWFVLLFTSTLHERVRCSHIQQETETYTYTHTSWKKYGHVLRPEAIRGLLHWFALLREKIFTEREDLPRPPITVLSPTASCPSAHSIMPSGAGAHTRLSKSIQMLTMGSESCRPHLNPFLQVSPLVLPSF